MKPQHNIVCKFQGPSIKAVTADAFVPSRLESKQCKYSFLVVCFLVFPFFAKLCKVLCNVLRYLLKDDLQSVLRTLESLFTTSVLFHVRRHKI